MTVTIINKGKAPIAARASIDKLAITFDVPEVQLKSIAHRIRAISKEKFGSKCSSRNYVDGTCLWLNEYLIKENPTSSCLVFHATPKYAGWRSCRVEWNPSKIPIDVVADVGLAQFLGVDPRLVGQGVVTRLDVAVDVSHIRVDDLLISIPQYRIAKNYFQSGTTRYIGGQSGSRFFCCYDKRAEIIQHNAKTRWDQHKITAPDYPLTRIEARLRPKIFWQAVGQTVNSFAVVKLMRFSSIHVPKSVSGRYLATTIALARHDGLTAALATLDKKPRALMRATIEASQKSCSWWNPTKLWEGFEHDYAVIDSRIGQCLSD